MSARVLGPWITVAAVIFAVRTPDMPGVLTAFTEDPVWPVMIGAIELAAGFAIVAFHQYWRHPAGAIVSALGWWMVVEAVLLLAVPGVFGGLADVIAGSILLWRIVCAAFAVLGLYLSYVGWRPVAGAIASAEPDTSVVASVVIR
ncbi:MAG: hypothetical protein DIU75_016310 [Mycolicibacterium hassiacum]|nr:hypothetical protein [Mycolicibacterium hassiacum]